MTLRLGDTLIAGSGANKDLSNLTSQGKNIANWSSNVTNCITEIPQDIKLELNNGTLTLKAGSKVYVPNGADKFDVVSIASDISFTYKYAPSTNTQCMLFINNTGTSFVHSRTVNTCYSGTTQPSGSFRNWYNTTENKMYSIGKNETFDGSGFSFPIAIITQGSDGVTKSIDQVFNGFGYIGSTVFVLPGVEGLIPNGRNADGSLKNIEFVNDRVKTFTLLNSETSILNLYDGTFGIDIATYTLSNFFIQNNAPTNYQYMLWLDTLNNEFKYTENTGNSWVKVNLFNVATLITADAGKITSFTKKTAFHAVDRNDSSWLSGLGMPSSRYIDLTLGATGATYTAPANGCFQLAVLSGASIQFYNKTRGDFWKASTSDGNAFAESIECQNGDIIQCYYEYTTFRWFRFYYAEGEN